MRRCSLLLLALLSTHALANATGQLPGPQDPPAAANRALDTTTAQALDRLATLLAEKRRDRDAAAARGEATTAADAELQKLAWQFASLTARFDVKEFEAPENRQFELQREIEQLIRPLLETLKDATARPRQISDLRARLEQIKLRQATVSTAMQAVERMRAGVPADAPAALEMAREVRERWQPQLRRLNDERLVLEANLQRLSEGQRSLWQSVSDVVRQFARSSGTSLVLATLVFLLVFFGLKALVDALLRRARAGGSFTARLLAVLLRLVVVLLAITAALAVPYVRDDWLLLAVGVVFLLGAGWVVARMAPQFFEQTRLLLNIGGVREGERILVDGLPFRVEALRFYTKLQNPDLQGGLLRVPLLYLVGKRSRQSHDDEPWFPCRVGEVVLLADGTFGPVRTQTPETVVVEHWGSPRSFPTVEFLRLNPRNLSRGFVVDAVCTIGRALPTDALAAAGPELQAALQRDLTGLVGDAVQEVRVEFQQVTPTGFELLAQARCAPAAAAQFLALRRAMQQAFVLLCQRRQWPLPTPLPLAATSS